MAVTKLRTYFRRLRHHKVWDSSARGIYCIEVGEIDDLGCSTLHIHAFIDSGFMEQKKLSRTWKVVTGGSYIVDIRAVNRTAGDSRSVMEYVTKYLAKIPHGVPEWKARLYNDTFHGTRLIQVFGFPHGGYQLDVRQPVCPYCGSVDVYCLDFEPNREDLMVSVVGNESE